MDMYYVPYGYFYYANVPVYTAPVPVGYWMNPYGLSNPMSKFKHGGSGIALQDYGPKPFVVNINTATKQNRTFRTALWTGKHLQLTLMSIGVGEDIGLEIHPNVDQFLRVEQGTGIVRMGQDKDHLTYEQPIADDSAIFVPAGTWHNVINTGNIPLKLYSIYAPPNHPFGTVHQTKAEAMAEEVSV